ncbi:MAG: AI-2E family transporter [Rubrobacteraceae bacterium]
MPDNGEQSSKGRDDTRRDTKGHGVSSSGGRLSSKTADGEVKSRRRRPARIPISSRTGKLLALAGIVALVRIVRYVLGALYIAGVGFAIALILSFPVRALSHIMPRWLAILLTYLLLVGLLILGALILVPLLVGQLRGLISSAPDIARSADRFARDLLQPLADRNMLSGTSPDQVISNVLDQISNRAQDFARNFLGSIVGYFSTAVNFGVNLLGALFVSVYLLLDVRRIKAAYLRALPHRYRWDGRELWNAEGSSLSKYLSGLALDLVIQGALTAIALFFLGVPYAILLGVVVSVTAIIPYVGAFLGGIPGVIVAFFVSPTTGVLTILVYIAIQQLDGNFIMPRIQGQVLRVHPIIVLLAIVIGGGLGGLVGIIVSVPLLAVLRVLFDFFRLRLDIED